MTATALEDVVFAGTPEFAAASLAALIASPHRVSAVYTQPDRPAGRGRRLRPSPVKELALEHDLPVRQPTTLNDPDSVAELAALNPGVMVVAAYGLLLPPPVLATPRHGCVNVHASLLPRWRGAAPIQRAILAGDEETGITIMQMDAGLDTGEMLLKRSTPISPTDTAGSLHDRLAGLGAEALVAALNQIAAGEARPEPQDDDQATYARKLNKDEAHLRWERTAVELDRQVRAFNPWPVTQTVFEGKTLRVWGSRPVDRTADAPPGTVLHAGHKGIEVATGEGLLRLLEVQLPGGKRLSAADFCNARRLEGAVLG